MSVVDQCKNYRSALNIYWKHRLGEIIEALKREAHPDQEIFSNVAITLMIQKHDWIIQWIYLIMER